MSKNKNKFDLTTLVKDGYAKEGEKFYFVSDPKFWCTIKRTPTHEYKVEYKGELHTIHHVAQTFLGAEPPDHANKWLRNEAGKTMYELWQYHLEEVMAA